MVKKDAVFDQYALDLDMPLSAPAFLAPHVQVPSGGRILDAGCGDGRFLVFCQREAPEALAIGIDVSRIRVRRTAEKGFIVSQADVENLPFANQTFNLVLLIEVIEHTWHPEAVLAEVARVLQPDGRLILTTPNYRIKRAYDWLDYLRGVHASPADDPTHFSPLSARRIKRLCLRYFATVEGEVSHIAGEGRWPVVARLRSVPLAADLLGRKIALFCQRPLQRGLR